MSNWTEEVDKLQAYYDDLALRHSELDKELIERYNNVPATDEARRMKTMKLWLKDEMYRVNQRLVQMGLE